MFLDIRPETDLTLTKTIAASPANVWRCLTEAALLEAWFCPKPWRAHNVVMDPRPGGAFSAPMRGPQGEDMPGEPGCILVVEAERFIMWTDALSPGFHPTGKGFMTASYTLEPVEAGTRLTARALHANAEARQSHEKMGFEAGWGTAMDQLGALAAGF